MIVLDASAAIDLLLDLPPHADTIRARLESTRSVAAPHLIDVEVGQVLRRRMLAGGIAQARAREALDDLAALPLIRYAHGPLLSRALDFRANATVYDGVYLALAEALGAVLLTRDAALAAVPGCLARVDALA
ncbi:MAG: type II toxin-antitoxin system VapC family toxin [Myxococcota bacterium]|mgnify:CR=1 FL=1